MQVRRSLVPLAPGFGVSGTAEPTVGARLDGLELTRKLLLRRALRVDVKGRVDPQPCGVNLRTEARLQLAPQRVDEVPSPGRRRPRAPRKPHRGSLRRLRLGARDHPLLRHGRQHVGAPAQRGAQIFAGIDLRWRHRQTRQQRRFRQRQRTSGLAEVFPCRRVDPVGAFPEVDVVQVELENFPLRESAFDLPRDPNLQHLATQAALPVAEAFRKQVARQLHRDRAAALRDPPLPQIRPQRAEQSAPIDALVLKEPTILRGHERLGHVGGQRIEGHDAAVHRRQDAEGSAPNVQEFAALGLEARKFAHRCAPAEEPTRCEPEPHEDCEKEGGDCRGGVEQESPTSFGEGFLGSRDEHPLPTRKRSPYRGRRDRGAHGGGGRWGGGAERMMSSGRGTRGWPGKTGRPGSHGVGSTSSVLGSGRSHRGSGAALATK